VTARFLHREFFTFQPDAKFWLATNKKPIVRDESAGFWRRIHLIPFTQSFEGREDKTLKDRLRDEASGILTWLVRGCAAWQRDGLQAPDAVRVATRKYREESGMVALAPFVEARCVVAPGTTVQAEPLYKAYVEWCVAFRVSDRDRLSQTAFGKKLKERFDVDPLKKRQVWYLGIGLREEKF
jgi:putative DNA primase/helicase